MDFLEVIESLETIPLTREVETIKGLEGFEQQDVPVWNNLTGYLGYIEVDDDTYENVLKAFLLLGEEWYLVIVTALACGGSKYEMLEIDDITSIDAGGFGPLMTSLTIDVPLSLVYSDAFNLTGELTDEDDNAISGAMVKLVIGNTVVDSKITNSSGVASFTQTPVHMGIHTFKLVYEGSDAYRNCQSSTVTRDINKETSVLNVTSPLNNTDVYSDGSLSIAGTLLTDDAEVLAGESILVKQGDDTLTTLTTDSTGAFSGTVAASSLSTGNIVISFETTTTHTASTATIAIVVSDPSLTLVSDKSILSYVDGDSATLTATLTGADVAGKTVSFDIVDSGGTVISNIDTAVTDENGECSVYYLSNHAGDLYIRAQSGILLSETSTISDILYYDACTSDKGHWSSTTDLSFSSNGVTIYKTAGDNTLPTLNITYPTDYEVEYEATSEEEGKAIFQNFLQPYHLIYTQNCPGKFTRALKEAKK